MYRQQGVQSASVIADYQYHGITFHSDLWAVLDCREHIHMLLIPLLFAAASGFALPAGPVHATALRLMPGDDLVSSILDLCEAEQHSAAIMTCVGSLSNLTLRLAGAEEMITLTEELEIVSLVGTMCANRDHHLHCSVSRRDGTVVGGHVKGAATVRTTAEVVLGVLPSFAFSRVTDEVTGYKELSIRMVEADDV